MQTLLGASASDPVSVYLNSTDEINLETTPCLLCRSSNSSIIHTFGQLQVVICRKCNLVYLNPRLNESAMRTVYQSDDYFSQRKDAGYEDYSFQEDSLRTTFKRFLEKLEKHGMTSGKILEVGCGYGYFLDEAKYFFSHREGIELSQDAGSYAGRLSGAHIHIGDVGSLPPELNEYAVIVLINVIEHIYSPVEFLCLIKQRLKNDGRIVVATPDIGSFWHIIMRKRWPSFKIPEHVAFYSGQTLRLLLQKTGFYDIRELPFPHAFPIGLIAHKLGLRVPTKLGKRSMWVPKTMVTLSARSRNE